jgi:hypothetical protein
VDASWFADLWLILRIADLPEQLWQAQHDKCFVRFALTLLLKPLAHFTDVQLADLDLVSKPFLSHRCPFANMSRLDALQGRCYAASRLAIRWRIAVRMSGTCAALARHNSWSRSISAWRCWARVSAIASGVSRPEED